MEILPINLNTMKSCIFDGKEVEFLQLNSLEIWKKETGINDVIIGIDLTKYSGLSGYVRLYFYKNDEAVNTIDWGDGTVEQITTFGQETSISHTYATKSKYDITITGVGSFKYFGQSGTTTATAPIMSFGIQGGSDAYDCIEYLKMGKICKGLRCPFGLNADDLVDVTTIAYTRSGTSFTGGENIPLCYYGKTMNYFNGMKNQINHILYDGGTENNWLGAFKTENQTILCGKGSDFHSENNWGLVDLSNFDFNGLGYISLLIKTGIEVTSVQSIIFPKTLVNFYSGGLYATGSNHTVKFLTPANAVVKMPNAGANEGFAYYKSARPMTIYTDNETIKNYDWATDNITATIYHLDGSLWE